MSVVTCLRKAIVGLVVLVVLAGCSGPVGTSRSEQMPLVFEADFEDGSLSDFQPTDPEAWRIEDGNGLLRRTINVSERP